MPIADLLNKGGLDVGCRYSYSHGQMKTTIFGCPDNAEVINNG